MKGFGVRVTPRGKLTFIVQGRVEGTEATPRITIGPYGVFTVDQAREQARERLRTMRQGLDPRDLRRQPDGRPFTVKVHGMSLAELLAFKGISREDFAAGLPDSDAEMRTLAERACKDALRDSNDAAVRRDAYDLLVSMGALQS